MVVSYKPDLSSVEYQEHTADLWIESNGKDIGSMMKNLCEGLYGVISNEFTLENEVEEFEMLFEGNDMDTSMVDMLNELLFIFDSEGAVIRDISFEIKSNNHSCALLLKGNKHHSTIPEGKGGMEVKAVTYHGVEIKCHSEVMKGKVLVDL